MNRNFLYLGLPLVAALTCGAPPLQAADFIVTSHFVDASNNIVASPSTADTDFYVALFIDRDAAGATEVGGLAIEAYYKLASCDYVAASITSISSYGAPNSLNVGPANAEGTPLAEFNDGIAATTHYRKIACVWSSACLPAAQSTDKLIRLKFRTTATPTYPVALVFKTNDSNETSTIYSFPSFGDTTATINYSFTEVPVVISRFDVD